MVGGYRQIKTPMAVYVHIFCDQCLFMSIVKMFCECNHNGKFLAQHTGPTFGLQDTCSGPRLSN